VELPLRLAPMGRMPAALKTFAQTNDGRAASGKAANRIDSREACRILPAQSLSQKHSSNRAGSRGHWVQLGCSLGDGPPIWRLVTQRRAGDWLFGDLPAGSLAGAEREKWSNPRSRCRPNTGSTVQPRLR
jgi:hypothetical protein